MIRGFIVNSIGLTMFWLASRSGDDPMAFVVGLNSILVMIIGWISFINGWIRWGK